MNSMNFFVKTWAWIISGPPILLALLTFVLGVIALFVIMSFVSKGMAKTKMDVSLQKFLTKTIKVTGIIIILICALSTAGISTTGLIAGFSAAGAAVALALKDSLSNIAGGIILLVTHPFVTGDYIAIGDKEGVVKQIDIIQTTIITVDNKTVVIPNGMLSSDHVVNYSAQKTRRVDLSIPVSYDNDIESAKSSVLKSIDKVDGVIDDPKPFVRVGEYSDSSVKLTVRVWCNTENYWDVHFALIEQIREGFKEDSITIPYQHIDVRMVSDK